MFVLVNYTSNLQCHACHYVIQDNIVGLTALHIAAVNSNLGSMKRLVSMGWSVTTQDPQDKTVLHIVCLLVHVYLMLSMASDKIASRVAIHFSIYILLTK